MLLVKLEVLALELVSVTEVLVERPLVYLRLELVPVRLLWPMLTALLRLLTILVMAMLRLELERIHLQQQQSIRMLLVECPRSVI